MYTHILFFVYFFRVVRGKTELKNLQKRLRNQVKLRLNQQPRVAKVGVTGLVNEEPVTGVGLEVVIAVVETVVLVNENEVEIDENVIGATEAETEIEIAVVGILRDEAAEEVVAEVKIVVTEVVEGEVAAGIIADRGMEVAMTRIARVADLNVTDLPVNVKKRHRRKLKT